MPTCNNDSLEQVSCQAVAHTDVVQLLRSSFFKSQQQRRKIGPWSQAFF